MNSDGALEQTTSESYYETGSSDHRRRILTDVPTNDNNL